MKIKRLLPAAMAVLTILAILACSASATPTPETPTDVTENALPSVVQIITNSGSGTGFIVHENGLVVTNKHVVEGERRVTVRLRTGEEYRGDVTQRHTVLDLAYVEIDSTRSFTPLPLGDSGEVRVSESVIAIGYPLSEELGLEPTVSLGIISAKRDDYLQTDASLNPGQQRRPPTGRKWQCNRSDYLQDCKHPRRTAGHRNRLRHPHQRGAARLGRTGRFRQPITGVYLNPYPDNSADSRHRSH